MIFTARILRGSAVWREWHNHHRVGGEIRGVRFSWIPGDDYVVAGSLSKGQVDALVGHSSVQVETVSADALRMIPPMEPEAKVPLPMPIVAMTPQSSTVLEHEVAVSVPAHD